MPAFAWTDQVTDVAQIDRIPMGFEASCFDTAALQALLRRAQERSWQVSAYGRRHSQGHQTLLKDALAVEIDALQGVQIDHQNARAHIGCGATWDHLHAALERARQAGRPAWAPYTHQSSPHFSVGGSLAANCHGRDPRQGPLANGVLSIELLLADGQTVTASPTQHPDLFETVLGGYGAAGLMLAATIQLKPESMLRTEVRRLGLQDYVRHIEQLAASGNWPAMQHAWACTANDSGLLQELLLVEGHQTDLAISGSLRQEGFFSDDLLAPFYDRLRKPGTDKRTVWELLCAASATWLGHGKTERLLNAMRQPVRFTALDAVASTDLLQEYFLPPAKLPDFMAAAAQLLRAQGVCLLTSTLRVVQADHHSLLRYAPELRVGVVLNFNIPLVDCRPSPGPSKLQTWTQQLVAEALQRGGSFYPTYHRGASPAQFTQAFGAPTLQTFRQRRRQFDSNLRFDNGMLQHYGL